MSQTLMTINTTTTTDAQFRAQVNRWLSATAVAAALFVGATEAAAQYRSTNDGRALDANHRVGSGGSNGDRNETRVGPSGNQIVTGNVTGGREFRGPVGYSDPREFRDVTGFENSDRFVRNSSGARRSSTLLQAPTAYYGSALAQPLPPSYAPTAGATGGYVMQPTAGSTAYGDNVGLGGVRPGAAGAFAGPLEQPSPLGLDASPLYGLRPLSNQSPLDALRNDPLYSTSGDVRVATDRAALQQMRDELNAAGQGRVGDNTTGANGTGENNPAGGIVGGGPNAAGGNTAAAGAGGAATPLGAALKSDVGSPVSQLQNNGLNSAVQNGAINSGLQTGQAASNRLLVPPAQQSDQYKALVQRLQNRQGSTSEAQQAADLNRLRAAQQQGNKAGQPGNAAQPPAGAAPKAPGGGGGGAPAANPRPGASSPAPAGGAVEGPAVPTEPLEIKSLATGVKAHGLASLLTSAEQSMKDQKYADAVGKYIQAARVAPNNPMITLGEGIAQLGGGNYGQAERALRSAITSEPALLMGRYDLLGMLGETRAKYLQSDLKQLAAAGAKEVRPRLLLAFLSYNTGNGPDAEKYVAEAAKLAPNDPVLQAMQKTWAVLGAAPASAPAPAPAEPNK